MIFAGLPATKLLGGISVVTQLLASITILSPIIISPSITETGKIVINQERAEFSRFSLFFFITLFVATITPKRDQTKKV